MPAFIQSFDETLQFFIQETLHTPLLDTFFIFITRLGDHGLLWIALGLVLLSFPKSRKYGFSLLLVLAVEWAVCDGVLKNLFTRPRPYTLYPDIPLYVKPLSSYSFPSGHSASSFAAAVTLFRFHKGYGTAALILAGLIAFSRLYLFMHWPSDVLIGALFGTLVSFVVLWLLRTIQNRYKALS